MRSYGKKKNQALPLGQTPEYAFGLQRNIERRLELGVDLFNKSFSINFYKILHYE